MSTFDPINVILNTANMEDVLCYMEVSSRSMIVGGVAQSYLAPVLVAQAAIKNNPTTIPTNGAILDTGCGTGLVVQALSIASANAVDGVDLSTTMLDVARKTGIYRNVVKTI